MTCLCAKKDPPAQIPLLKATAEWQEVPHNAICPATFSAFFFRMWQQGLYHLGEGFKELLLCPPRKFGEDEPILTNMFQLGGKLVGKELPALIYFIVEFLCCKQQWKKCSGKRSTNKTAGFFGGGGGVQCQ